MQPQSYCSALSSRQKLLAMATVFLAAAVVVAGLVLTSGASTRPNGSYSIDMTIKQIAPALDVTGKALARELKLPMDAAKSTPLADLGVAQPQLDATITHLQSHQPTGLKYYLYVAIVLLGMAYLLNLGRPARAPGNRKLRYPRWPYVAMLIVAALACGFLLGKSPNPMEGAVKPFKAMVGLYPSAADKWLALAFFLGLAIVGNKLICGWACPLGAVQELLYSLPVLGKLKKRKVPFVISNGIRVALFAVVMLVLFGWIANIRGFVLYHHLNAFNLFDLRFETPWILATTVVVLVTSLFVYRPFCHFICPFGLLSWVAERASIARVRVDRSTCNACGSCVRACPGDAAKGIIEGKRFGADCFSCARCLNVCPTDALRFSLTGRRQNVSAPSSSPIVQSDSIAG